MYHSIKLPFDVEVAEKFLNGILRTTHILCVNFVVKNSKRWRCFVGRKLYVDSRYVMSGASSFHAESLLPKHIDLFISDSFHISTLRACMTLKNQLPNVRPL